MLAPETRGPASMPHVGVSSTNAHLAIGAGIRSSSGGCHHDPLALQQEVRIEGVTHDRQESVENDIFEVIHGDLDDDDLQAHARPFH
eukprot:7879892-Karenia_brevis.AAC.1